MRLARYRSDEPWASGVLAGGVIVSIVIDVASGAIFAAGLPGVFGPFLLLLWL